MKKMQANYYQNFSITLWRAILISIIFMGSCVPQNQNTDILSEMPAESEAAQPPVPALPQESVVKDEENEVKDELPKTDAIPMVVEDLSATSEIHNPTESDFAEMEGWLSGQEDVEKTVPELDEKRAQEEQKVEEERLRQEAEAEKERLREEAQATEKERLRKEAEQKVEAERLKKEAEQNAARERQQAFNQQMENKVGVYRYTWKLDGSDCGSQTITITKPRQDQLQVVTEINMKVSFAFVFSYSYQQKVTEIWYQGRLYSFSSSTNDNGTTSTLAVTPQENLLMIKGGQHGESVAQPATTSICWNFTDLNNYYKDFSLIEVQTGEIISSTATNLPAEKLTVGGRQMLCRHIKLGKTWELWFNDAGVLVKTKDVLDGYVVEAILQR